MVSQDEIPEGWQLKEFEEVVEIHDSRREPVSSEKREERIENLDRDKLYPYYGAGGQIGWIDDYIFNDNYTLVAEDGATTGYTYRISGKSWVSNHAHVLKADRANLTDDFLFYFLKSYDFEPLKTGGTRPKLTQRNLKKVKVPLPPLDEQKLISSTVEEQLSQIKKLKKRVRVMGGLVKEYEDSLISFLTLGKDPSERSTIIGVPQQGDLPKGWDTTPLSEVANVNPRISYDEQSDYAYVPMDAVSAEKKDITRYERRESLYSGLSEFSEGDIILARITPCFENGKMAIASEIPTGYDFAVGSTEFVVIRPTEINTEYLFLYLSSPIVKQWGERRLLGSTGRERIKISQFRDDLTVPVPPEETQSQIVDNIGRINFDEIRNSVSLIDSRFDEYRSSLLAYAVRGELHK